MKSNHGMIAGMVFAAAFLTASGTIPAAHAQSDTRGAELITNGPQSGPGEMRGDPSAPQNVRASQRYESLVHSNPNFRAVRERKECGPIDDARLHEACVASFGK